MFNIYDYIANKDLFKKFEVNDLLFVEYKCLIDEVKTGYWTHNNYFVYVVGGKKRWATHNKEYLLSDNQAIFIKKGAYLAHNYYEEEFCALCIFVPDDFIKSVLAKYISECPNIKDTPNPNHSIIPIHVDETLTGYFRSMMSYFPKEIPPPKNLLTIKLQELILTILSDPKNGELACYFREVQETTKVSIRDIMENYFMYDMGLNEYARLCARSLSTFKADFFETFKMTPGKWLICKRLEFAKFLTETTDKNINDVAFESGFKNTSHFIRLFKQTYGNPPLQHRMVHH